MVVCTAEPREVQETKHAPALAEPQDLAALRLAEPLPLAEPQDWAAQRLAEPRERSRRAAALARCRRRANAHSVARVS